MAIYKRHRYDRATNNRVLDNSPAACVRCGVIREFVRGEVHYFINDTVYLKAPVCDSEKWKNESAGFWAGYKDNTI